MPEQARSSAIGLMGGTFDPVHIGHLRVATEFAEAFDLEEVKLIPCHKPVHRDIPHSTPQQRHDMLELAVAASQRLSVDDIELQLDEPSYTIDTLKAWREKAGSSAPLYFALGSDAFNAIEQWKEWSSLFELANFVVLHRPGNPLQLTLPSIQHRLAHFDGMHTASGHIYTLQVSSIDISSSQIRELLQQHKSIDYLVPETVKHYIEKENLYN